MSKPYDATLKAMLEASPADWTALIGLHAERIAVIDADVSTVTAATDKVLRLSGPDVVAHFDFQAGPDAILPRRVHGYNALLEERHGLPVQSVVLLLRPQANLRAISGVYERRLPGTAEPYLTFRYQVIRIWELRPEPFLTGGPGTLPLAPISAVTAGELPGVIHAMKETLEAPRYRKLAGTLWTAVDVLLGLRYERAMIDQLLQGVRGMKESVTYQAIVEEGVAKGVIQGRLEEARRILLRLGEHLFSGPAPESTRAQLESITELELLEQLSDRVVRVSSWPELVANLPAPKPRRPRRKKS
ncbi:MAG: hypothetical protein K2R98_14735 [Gemmataceae bacterium]|nr:hypothetical protein [Gemmataceae bacterium]